MSDGDDVAGSADPARLGAERTRDEARPAAELSVGAVVAGKFRITGEGISGGMGVVYPAVHVVFDEPRALKFLHAHLVTDADAVDRFRRTARIARRLEHPGIVRIHDFDEWMGAAYLVMEWIGGGSLRQLLRLRSQERGGDRRVPLAEAIALVESTAEALAYAHLQRVVHYDVKPDNILLDGSRPKLADFGIAQAMDAQERSATSVRMGAAAYMAPERLNGRAGDHRCDLYGLGVVLYELVCGGVPTAFAALPSQIDPSLPTELDALVKRCLMRNPHDRFRSVVEFQAELVVVKQKIADRAREEREAAQRRQEHEQRQRRERDEADRRRLEEEERQAQRAQREQKEEARRRDAEGLRDRWSVLARRAALALIATPGRATAVIIGVVMALIATVDILSSVYTTSQSGSPASAPAEVMAPTPAGDTPRAAPQSPPPASAPAPPAETPRTATGKDGASMVLVPAGEFWMGSEEHDNERPRLRVYLDAFYIDQYETTNALYRRFMEATRHQAPSYWGDSNFNDASQPVVGVWWDDADAYCRWAGKRSPTEAEWEKAARGTDGRKYPWGEQWDASRANAEHKLGRTAPVGSYPGGVSPYGAHDMAGNVWEWVADWYGPYKRSKRNPRGPDSGPSRVLRGGSWDLDPSVLRAAVRATVARDPRPNFGFRCARGSS